MTPIVFCPSLPPWLNAMYALERICALPKKRWTACAVASRKAQYSPSMRR